jgi:hypothetical protein
MKPNRLPHTIALLLILLPFSCQRDLQLELQKDLPKISFTTLDKEPPLERVIQTIGFTKQTARNGRLMSALGEIQPDSILKVLQANGKDYSYSMALNGRSRDGTFKNLVLKEATKGFYAYVMEYDMLGKTKANAFTGTAKRYDLEGTPIGEVALGKPNAGNTGGRAMACFADVTVECVNGGGTSTATGLPLPCFQWAIMITIDCMGGSGGGGGGSGGWSSPGTYLPFWGGGAGGSSGGGSSSGVGNNSGGPTLEGGIVMPSEEEWASNLILNAPPAGDIITDINHYLKCFDLGAAATVTIYVDQPKPNSRDTWSGFAFSPDVGHTFISIKQGSYTRVLGFYPTDGVNPINSPSDASSLVDDSNHEFDTKIDVNITPTQLAAVIDLAKNKQSIYNLNTYNCTDFGLGVANACGVALPDTNGTWPGGGGSNPGDLGEDMRSLTPPPNSTITKTTGNAPSNSGTCN